MVTFLFRLVNFQNAAYYIQNIAKLFQLGILYIVYSIIINYSLNY